MKKLLLTLAVSMVCFGAMGQDTLLIHPSEWPSNYYKASYWQEYDSVGYLSYWGSNIAIDQEGWRIITEDTLTIYGLAVSVSTMELMDTNRYINDPGAYYNEVVYVKDTTYECMYDYYRIYAADSCTLRQVSEDLVVHIKHTPIAYYMNTGLLHNFHFTPLPVVPVYEVYFSEPVTVTDSFYIGRSLQAHRWLGEDGSFLYTTKEPILIFLQDLNQPNNYIKHAQRQDTSFYHLHSFELEYYTWVYGPIPSGPLFFPILTPEDTTQHHNGDTLTIGSASLTDRLTGVMPNPASGTAKVVSSLGLKEVEVYNSAGDLVHRQAAQGLSTTLDTHAWPNGTYLLRIATPQGISTKKLVVSH